MRRALLLTGGLSFVLALFLPSVDNHYGDYASGFAVKGYQCALGLPAMPLVVPFATPLWLVLLAGNLWIIAASCSAVLGRCRSSFLVRTRWIPLLAVAGLGVLTVLRRPLGLTAIHAGYALWAAGLVLVCFGAWLPRGPHRSSA